MEKQLALPDDFFAPEAVGRFIKENPLIDPMLEYSLRESGRVLATRSEHPRQLENVRGFLKAIIGFGHDRA